jgi:hypothetical protein
MRRVVIMGAAGALPLACASFEADVSADAAAEGGLIDPRVDAGPPSDASDGIIRLSGKWNTPNGALFRTTDAGLMITGFSGAYGHALVFPDPQPDVPSDDFTVHARVYAPNACEFGIATRVQDDNSSVILASRFGGDSIPFLGVLSSSSGYNPTRDVNGSFYEYEPTRYRLMLRATGSQMQGKFWNVADSEPSTWFSFTGPWTLKRGIGFYVYALGTFDAVLEQMYVTVP